MAQSDLSAVPFSMCVQTVGADRRFCSGDPDIFVSTDFMPNYTSLIFSVPKNKSGLFNKTQPKDETALSMSAWVGDFSQERDEDVELPDAAYHVDFYLADPYGGQGGCTIETFVEDSEKGLLAYHQGIPAQADCEILDIFSFLSPGRTGMRCR